MTKNIQLVLTGCQRDETGGESLTETRSEAEYYEKNGGFYILYEEIPEGSKTPVRNRIKFKDSVLELTKRGAVSTRMVFETGTEQRTEYVTPFGGLQMEISTGMLESSFRDDAIVIRVEYTLSCNGRFLSDCALTISIFPKTG